MAVPVISYPGGKWRFYPYMVDYFPTDMKTFIEPFFGGGSVSLSVADDPRFTKLERMIGGDLAPEIWAFWQGIKTSPDAVVEVARRWFAEKCPHHDTVQQLGITASSMREVADGKDVPDELKKLVTDNQGLYDLAVAEAEAFWKWAETVDTSELNLFERAARTYLVNKISFSAMGDSGSLSKDRFFDFTINQIERVYQASKLLQRIDLHNTSFENTMAVAHDNPENTFIFLDPPYFTQEGSGLYGRNGDTHKGFPHQKFAEYTKSMPCKWFITYDDSVAVRRLFLGKTALGGRCYMTPFTIPGGYTMAGKVSEDALAGEELFITNYDIKQEADSISALI